MKLYAKLLAVAGLLLTVTSTFSIVEARPAPTCDFTPKPAYCPEQPIDPLPNCDSRGNVLNIQSCARSCAEQTCSLAGTTCSETAYGPKCKLVECPAGTHKDYQNNCIGDCRANERQDSRTGQCVPRCGLGDQYDAVSDRCVPVQVECGLGSTWNPQRRRCEEDTPALTCRDIGNSCGAGNRCEEGSTICTECAPGTDPQFCGCKTTDAQCVPDENYVPECPASQTWNPQRRRCIQDHEPVTCAQLSCGAGYRCETYFTACPAFGECRFTTQPDAQCVRDENYVADCRFGRILNPQTGKCERRGFGSSSGWGSSSGSGSSSGWGWGSSSGFGSSFGFESSSGQGSSSGWGSWQRSKPARSSGRNRSSNRQ